MTAAAAQHQTSDAYIIKRASEIVAAVKDCGCDHCLELLKKSKNAGLTRPSRTTPVPEQAAVILDGQFRYDYG